MTNKIECDHFWEIEFPVKNWNHPVWRCMKCDKKKKEAVPILDLNKAPKPVPNPIFPKPFINKCLEVSIIHIKQSDDDLLIKAGNTCTIVVYEYGAPGVGYFIHIPEEKELFQQTASAMKKVGYSDEIIYLLGWAFKENCQYLQIDCDGKEYDTLPKFNW
jgi:hypothetical protein